MQDFFPVSMIYSWCRSDYQERVGRRGIAVFCHRLAILMTFKIQRLSRHRTGRRINLRHSELEFVTTWTSHF